MSDGVTSVEALLDRHREDWEAATSGAAFIAGARDGSLAPEAFERWLVQDRHFVDGLCNAQLRVAALTSGEIRRTHLNGLVALQEELDWQTERGRERNLDLDTPPVEVCTAFIEFTHTFAFAPVAVAQVAIWTLERAYLDAWSAARPGAEAYREFIEHWSHAGFEAYVTSLQQGADELLAAASEDGRQQAERAFLRVMDFERRFWRMTEGA